MKTDKSLGIHALSSFVILIKICFRTRITRNKDCLAIKILSYKYNAWILQGEIDVDQVTVHTYKH